MEHVKRAKPNFVPKWQTYATRCITWQMPKIAGKDKRPTLLLGRISQLQHCLDPHERKMASVRSRLGAIGRALRARGQILFQQPSMELWRVGDAITIAERAEFTRLEYIIMISRYVIIWVDGFAMVIGTIVGIVTSSKTVLQPCM